MSEKRFEVDVDHILLVWDTEKNKRLEIEDIVGVLNEQQATLNKQKEEIINSHIAYVESLNEIKDLKEENEQLRQSYKYADELLEEIREVFEKNGVETGYNKRILETCFSALYENEQLRNFIELMNMRQKWKLYNYKRDNDERETNRNYFSKESAELD